MDGRNPAPPKKPWHDDSPVNTNKQRFPMVSSGAGICPPTVGLQRKIHPNQGQVPRESLRARFPVASSGLFSCQEPCLAPPERRKKTGAVGSGDLVDGMCKAKLFGFGGPASGSESFLEPSNRFGVFGQESKSLIFGKSQLETLGWGKGDSNGNQHVRRGRVASSFGLDHSSLHRTSHPGLASARRTAVGQTAESARCKTKKQTGETGKWVWLKKPRPK